METNLTHQQRTLLNIIPRIAAGLSLICATYMIYTILRSKYYRGRMYHRIMLGISFNIIIVIGMCFWGSAASPLESDNLGAKGNQATCTAQGFLYYVSLFITPLYYCALSILCFVAVRKKFKYNSIVWVEKYVHCAVVLIPLAAACYIASVNGYNYINAGCSVASIPTGCGDPLFSTKEETVEVCTRGPQNIAQIHFFGMLVPGMLLLLTPLVVMLLFCLRVSREDRIHRDVTKSMIIQSVVHILVLLAIYIFRIIYGCLFFFGGEYVFVWNLLANTNEALIGIWILLSYLYFRSDNVDYFANGANNDDDKVTTEIADSSQGGAHTETEQERCVDAPAAVFFKKPEFSIFDGSDVNSDSPWSKFLSEGVDEDYEEGRVWQQ